MGIAALLKFHGLQLRRFQPVLLVALVISSTLLVLSLGSYLVNANKLTAEQNALVPLVPSLQAPVGAPAIVKPLALPPFESAILVSAIAQASASMKVNTDELTFVLEDGTGQPYRRYRASFVMVGRYPQIRATIATVLHEVPYSALDTIKCMRNDIGEVDVGCTINMSAFYERAQTR